MIKFNNALKDMQTYEAGKPIELVVREYGIKESDVVKLASNENPLGTNPLVEKVLKENSSKAHLYPDDSYFELKEVLAKKFGVGEKNLIIGAGSDQVLEFISRALLNENEAILTSNVTFAMYEIYAKQLGAKIIKTPSYRHIVDEFLEAYKKHKPKIVYLCTPNNPTGDALKREDAIKIIEAVDKSSLVVVDGAYMEYAIAKDDDYGIFPRGLLKYENVIYLGTFSKAYGLGGLRVGYGIAKEKIIKELLKMRPPFNISTLSLAGAIEACKDSTFVTKSIEIHKEEIKKYEEFAKEMNFEYIESYTNFITYLFKENIDSSKIAQILLERGVIIRNLASYGLNGIRITVGTEKQNSRFFEEFKKVYKLI